MSAAPLAVARSMYDSREHTTAKIPEVLGVSRATFYRHLGAQRRSRRRCLMAAEAGAQGQVHRLQEGALSAAKTPAPPAPTKLVPIANGSPPAQKPATDKKK